MGAWKAYSTLTQSKDARALVWTPQSEKYIELWQRWRKDTEDYATLPKRRQACPRCSRGGGPASHVYLCRRCFDGVKKLDAGLPANAEVAAELPPHFPRSEAVAEILTAAYRLGKRFSLEQLAVAVWVINKDRWGMKGFRQVHPDMRKLAVMLYGKKGIAAAGLIVRVSEEQWELVEG